MTTDSNERRKDQSGADDYGKFVFGDDRSEPSHDDSSSTLEQRLAPIVALLVIMSLVLTGSYLAATTLSGPIEDVFGPTAGSRTDAASDGPAGTPGANSSTTKTPTTMDSTTSGRTATSTTATSEPGTSTGTTLIPDRSPSIDDFSTAPEQSTGRSGEAITVRWAVSDPDGDLETVRIRIVSNLDGSAKIVERRTVAVSGSKANGETVLELRGVAPGDAYELRLETEDRAGNVAVVVTRETARE